MWHHIQANFANILNVSATAMLVSSLHGMVAMLLGKTTKCSLTFYLVHTTLANYIWVIGIISTYTHPHPRTLGWNFKPFHKVNQKLKHFCCCYLRTALFKRKPRRNVAKSCAYGCIPRRTHPLSLNMLTGCLKYVPMCKYRTSQFQVKSCMLLCANLLIEAKTRL